jgi:hypothetical protein
VASRRRARGKRARRRRDECGLQSYTGRFTAWIMQIVHHVTEGGAVSNEVYNAAHVFSRMNRKMIAPVDDQGNAQAFGLNVQVISGGTNTVTLSTASNSYVTKQAVKSWFKVWKKSLTDAGYSMKDLGPYARVFKPRLEASETLLGGPGSHTGEWNYTEMVTEPAGSFLDAGVEAADLSDKFTLHLCGSSVRESSGDETIKFTNVGMIESWLGSRKKYAGADNTDNSEIQEDRIFDSDNPLLLARGQSSASKMLLEEVRDIQKDEPPYVDTEFESVIVQSKIQTDANLTGVADIVAPLGLVKVTTTAACTLIFTLTGIGDM